VKDKAGEQSADEVPGGEWAVFEWENPEMNFASGHSHQ
jgi:hypothetical protein